MLLRCHPLLFRFLKLFLAISTLPTIANAQIFPPDAIVEGKTISEWVGKIQDWEWYLVDQGISEFDARAVHPNDLASVNNDGPVYFTAGFYGRSDGPVVENLVIPAGRPILVRAYDFSWDTAPQPLDANGLPPDVTGDPEAGFGAPDAQQLLAALTAIGDTEPIFFEVDGLRYTQEQLDMHRVNYEAIVTIGQNDFSIPPGDWPQVGDGYWFMMEPFALGEQHTTRAGGLDGGDVTLNFTAVAVPEPTSFGLLAIAGLILPLMRRRRMF